MINDFAFPLSKTEAELVADIISLYLAVMPDKMHKRVEETVLEKAEEIALLALRLRNYVNNTTTHEIPEREEFID